MGIAYDSVVPWGRSFDEYVRMFGLSDSDFSKKILGCGDGPASFNAGMYQRGKRMISIDPIYQFSRSQIRKRIDETYEEVVRQTSGNKDRFIWTTFSSVDELCRTRMEAMDEFLADYETGLRENRYCFAELPHLPFENDVFELTLSAHFLFFYSDNLDEEFHVRSIDEMLRVSDEVRIFPIVDLNAETSRYLEQVYNHFSSKGVTITEEKVDYEFQKGGNVMVKFMRRKDVSTEPFALKR